jgi:hypothetical protein
LLGDLARVALLDDLLGNRRKEPAVLGLAEQSLSLHSSGAIIAPGLCEGAEYLLGLGEATLALLRKNQVPLHEHVELAGLAFGCFGLVLRPVVYLGRETRGPAVIAVSDGAVVDLDLHVHERIEAVTECGALRGVRSRVGTTTGEASWAHLLQTRSPRRPSS